VNAFDRPTLIAELRRDEGVKLKPYRDTVGKLTLGVGRNLDDVGISDDEASALLSNDIDRACRALDLNLSWWRNLDSVRQRVLVNMCFNLGIVALLGFKDTLAAVQSGNWQAAHDGMLASKWAQQVGARATRLALMMFTGE
jgi:lysozyme